MNQRRNESASMRTGAKTSASGKTAAVTERVDAGNRFGAAFSRDAQAEMSLQADGWNFRLIV